MPLNDPKRNSSRNLSNLESLLLTWCDEINPVEAWLMSMSDRPLFWITSSYFAQSRGFQNQHILSWKYKTCNECIGPYMKTNYIVSTWQWFSKQNISFIRMVASVTNIGFLTKTIARVLRRLHETDFS